jgi:hypothetical protein
MLDLGVPNPGNFASLRNGLDCGRRLAPNPKQALSFTSFALCQRNANL